MIGYDAVASLKSTFQTQLTSATNDLINQITVIFIIKLDNKLDICWNLNRYGYFGTYKDKIIFYLGI